jgi:uncharacterized protein YndB with AHSA1/START domain
VSDRIEASRTINASPEQVFAVLADPKRHSEFDSANMLRGAGEKNDRVSKVGDEFVIEMHNDILGDYQIVNEIVSFEENRRIGWAPRLYPSVDAYRDKLGDMDPGGHTYTWELEPASDGSTKVTQIYDWSKVNDATFRGLLPMLNQDQIGDSIDRVGRVAK